MAKQRSEDASARANASARLGYALLVSGVVVAVQGGVLPHGAWWIVAAALLWAGVTLVGRARDWKIKRFLDIDPRKAVAATVLAVTLGGAVLFGSLRLDAHGNYPACAHSLDNLFSQCAPASRGVRQFPVAVTIAALGAVAAFAALKRT